MGGSRARRITVVLAALAAVVLVAYRVHTRESTCDNVLDCEAACTDGVGSACRRAGLIYRRGDRVARSDERAVSMLRAACKAKDARGCGELGDVLTERGDAREEALASFRAACEGHDALGCFELAGLYDAGDVVAADLPRAEALLVEACDRGAGLACDALGKRLASRDAARASRLHARALKQLAAECDARAARSCGALGWAQEHGLGTAPDGAQAASAYARGCDGGDGQSCYNLAATRNLASAKDPTVKTLFERACKLGVAKACGYEAEDPRGLCEAMRARGELKEGVSIEDCERALGE